MCHINQSIVKYGFCNYGIGFNCVNYLDFQSDTNTSVSLATDSIMTFGQWKELECSTNTPITKFAKSKTIIIIFHTKIIMLSWRSENIAAFSLARPVCSRHASFFTCCLALGRKLSALPAAHGLPGSCQRRMATEIGNLKLESETQSLKGRRKVKHTPVLGVD